MLGGGRGGSWGGVGEGGSWGEVGEGVAGVGWGRGVAGVGSCLTSYSAVTFIALSRKRFSNCTVM